jgi:RNA polymerase sigma-70 factor (ECF subfamily)
MCDDANRIHRIATERDEDAFDAITERYREPLLGFLIAQVNGDRAAADDLLQETFLRLWTRADTYDGRGPVKAWLFRIAANLAQNYRRTLSRRREAALSLSEEDGGEDTEIMSPVPSRLIEDAAHGPDAATCRSDERTRLIGLLADLPDETREMLRLVWEEESELRTVAARFGLPEGTVKSRLHYTRKRLARVWREQGNDLD